MMLVHHLFLGRPEYGTTIVNLALACKVCVAMFVFLSGYGMTVTFPKVTESRIKVNLFFLCKRYAKFFLNYWFVFFIMVPLGVFVFGRPLEAAYVNTENIFESFEATSVDKARIIKYLISDLLGQQGLDSYNITWWFNAIVLMLWLFFPIFYWMMKTKVLSICFIAFVLINPGNVLNVLHYVVALGFPTYIVPFVMGILVALRIDVINRLLNKSHPYFILGLSTTISVLLLCLRGVLSPYWGFKVEPFACVFLVLSTVSFCRLTKLKLRWLQCVGKHSMNMYLTHTFIFSYFFSGFIYGFKMPILIFLALFFTSFLLSVCLEFVKKKIGFYKLQNKVVDIIIRIGGLTPKGLNPS